uniref:HOOK domain-containing protein n=1 Tax=Taenia asiatica TaxID=60517 RepID=A0A0R3WGW5_TAEAS
LRLRLDMMKKMEMEYLEEIEELKGMVDSLTHQLEERRYDPHPESAGNLTLDANKSTIEIVQQIDLLQSELELSEKKITDLETQNALLRERIDILELTKESTTLNATVENTTNELIAEVDSLKSRLLFEVSEKERMHTLLEEKEQDLGTARFQISELQLAVKNLREEMCDLTAELEGLKLQAGSVGDSRGNSLFSEVEDRRRRAELLVKNQQIAIDELKNELNSVQCESRKRILQLQREVESKMTKTDSALITQLYAEVDRLKTEVSRLESILNTGRDQHLTDLREADRMSTAFRPDNSSHHNLIKALEERLLDHKCNAEKAKQELASLRERFMKETHIRYDLSRELAQQRALVQCLSQKLQSLQIASKGT